MNDIKKIKKGFKGPVSILVHGGNSLSFGIAKALLEQGGKVIIVDHYNQSSKKYITLLKELGEADFIDFKGLEELLKNVPSIDYLFYFLNEFLVTTSTFTSRDFLEETTRLNLSLKYCRDLNAKFSLITTVKLNQELSEHILNSKMSVPSPYSPIELQKYCETLVAEYRDKSKINARIIRVGTILGKDSSSVEDTTIDQLIDETVNKTFLTIKGEGLDTHYIINTTDAIYGILKLTFSQKTEGEVVTLANPNEYTTLSLAYKLLEINPDLLEIKFVEGDKTALTYSNNYTPAPNAIDFGWTQKITLEQTLIDSISISYPNKAKMLANRPKKTATEEKTIIKKSKSTQTPIGELFNKVSSPIIKIGKGTSISFKNIKENFTPRNIPIYILSILAFFVLFYFLVFPLISLTISSTSMYFNTKRAYSDIKSLDFKSASAKLNKAYLLSVKTEKSFSKLKWIFNLTKQKDVYDNTSQLIFASQYAFSGAKDLTTDLIPLSQFVSEYKPSINFGSDIPAGSQNYRLYLKELQNNASSISKASNDIELASSLISDIKVGSFPKLIQKQLITLKTTNENILNAIEPAKQLMSFLPELLGVNGRQRYLILLENPGEIRSTGGWLSSYAIVALDGGQIKELKVDDIYNAEGQLRLAGKFFDAPTDMQKALGITRWSVSLSNWNPNLSQTADTAEYFLGQLDPGTTFNGVITVDTEFLKLLLKKWDGITVPGETDKVTADNLDAKIFQLHSEFIPGQTIKSTFLANLANEVFKKIFSSNIAGYRDIVDVMVQALNEKHVQVASNLLAADSFFDANNWSGEMDKKYLAAPSPIEWNWGGNKANLYLERNYSLNLTVLDRNTISYAYEVFIKNDSTKNSYPQGEYKNYFRAYIPSNAQIQSVTGFVDGKYTVINQAGFKIVGGWFNVPIKSTRNLQIKYKLVNGVGSKYFPITQDPTGYSLDLNIFKQAGMLSDLYDLKISYPDTWATVMNTGLDRDANSLTARFNLNTPKEYNIVWKQK